MGTFQAPPLVKLGNSCQDRGLLGVPYITMSHSPCPDLRGVKAFDTGLFRLWPPLPLHCLPEHHGDVRTSPGCCERKTGRVWGSNQSLWRGSAGRRSNPLHILWSGLHQHLQANAAAHLHASAILPGPGLQGHCGDTVRTEAASISRQMLWSRLLW